MIRQIIGRTSMPKPSVVFEPVNPASTAVYWDLVTCARAWKAEAINV
jgi:hypothetical protein